MDAIKLLKQQHRAVKKLFKQMERCESPVERHGLFLQIADQLVVHTTIEERHFYPLVRTARTDKELARAFEEHLEVKQLLIDALDSTSRPGFLSKVAALRGAVELHIKEEEDDLFVQAKSLVGPEGLEAVGREMDDEAKRLMAAGEPRWNLHAATEPPAPMP